MEDGRKSAFTSGQLLNALSSDAKGADERGHPALSPVKSISRLLDQLMRERESLKATITELETRLAVSEELVDQLRKELARKDGRSSGKEDPTGV